MGAIMKLIKTKIWVAAPVCHPWSDREMSETTANQLPRPHLFETEPQILHIQTKREAAFDFGKPSWSAKATG